MGGPIQNFSQFKKLIESESLPNYSDEQILYLTYVSLKSGGIRLGDLKLEDQSQVKSQSSKEYNTYLITPWGEVGFDFYEDFDAEFDERWIVPTLLVREIGDSEYFLKAVWYGKGPNRDEIEFQRYGPIQSLELV